MVIMSNFAKAMVQNTKHFQRLRGVRFTVNEVNVCMIIWTECVRLSLSYIPEQWKLWLNCIQLAVQDIADRR